LTNLYAANAQEAKKDTYKLLGVHLDIPTDEMLAKWKENGSEFEGVPVSLAVEWEPQSYRIEGGQFGNKEFDRIRLTKSGGVSPEGLANVRAGGYPAIPQSAMYKYPANPAKANPAKQAFPIQRFMVMAAKAGIDLSIDNDGSVTGKPGELYSKDAGKLFECTSGYEDFPTWVETDKGVKPDWEDTKAVYMRLPIARVENFVAPAELPVRHIEAREDSGNTGGAAVSAVSSGGAVDSTGLLKAAVEKIGIVGKTVEEVNEGAMGFVARNLAVAPVLGTTEVANAARGKQLVEYLVNKGVVSVTDGVVAVAA
jgi:hypothetical protein